MSKFRQFKHGGNIYKIARDLNCATKDIIDFSANLNPLGAPSWMRRRITNAIEQICYYPDPKATDLKDALAIYNKIDPTQIVLGNGAEEILYNLPSTFKPKRIVLQAPSYIDYGKVAVINNIEPIYIKSNDDFSLDIDLLKSQIRDNDLVILAHPNNPTGLLLDKLSIIEVVQNNPKVNFIIDEAFIDFAGIENSFINYQIDNLFIMRSMTKFWAIPGLRLGYLIKPANSKTKFNLPEWNINYLAQIVGKYAIEDLNYRNDSVLYIAQLTKTLISDLKTIKELQCYPTTANFILCKSQKPLINLCDILLKKYKIAVRLCDNYQGLTNCYIRIAVRSNVDNQKLLYALKQIYNQTTIHKPIIKTTPALMIQGCSSNAGKSIIAAAICRVLMQDGFKVAPFKSQNMSLNSYVTKSGFEMSRAQVVQAQACRIDPDIRMNPILLKPNSNTGTQVIINGKPIGNMSVAEYIKYKPTAFNLAKKAYDSLALENQVMILEGAGSPGEVNLKSHDIVNMQMAKYAKSPVILVGDIDRGGVFASFVGTMEVCDQWERDLIAGFLVNRFRGDASLLQDAFDYCYQHTNKNVIGVVEYINKLGIPEEDSVSFKDGKNCNITKATAEITIVVIDLPHFANISDIDPFHDELDVNIKVSSDYQIIKDADAIIIPGSKCTLTDMCWLRQKGLDSLLIDLANKNTCIVGICAGFQIMGKKIIDINCIESSTVSECGLGILDMYTEMADSKTLQQVNVVHKPSQLTLSGYEIHHGKTTALSGQCIFEIDNQILGLGNNNIWGSYLHGIFDNDKFRRLWIDEIRHSKGLNAFQGQKLIYDLEPAFNHLADTFRQGVNIDKLYQLIGI